MRFSFIPSICRLREGQINRARRARVMPISVELHEVTVDLSLPPILPLPPVKTSPNRKTPSPVTLKSTRSSPDMRIAMLISNPKTRQSYVSGQRARTLSPPVQISLPRIGPAEGNPKRSTSLPTSPELHATVSMPELVQEPGRCRVSTESQGAQMGVGGVGSAALTRPRPRRPTKESSTGLASGATGSPSAANAEQVGAKSPAAAAMVAPASSASSRASAPSPTKGGLGAKLLGASGRPGKLQAALARAKAAVPGQERERKRRESLEEREDLLDGYRQAKLDRDWEAAECCLSEALRVRKLLLPASLILPSFSLLP